MGYFEKIRSIGKKQDIGLPSSYPEEDNIEEEIFEDFDKEKDKVDEWWLQKGVEEVIEEEPEDEDLEEEKEAASEENKDDLIYSLREAGEEEDEMEMALKTAMEEMGDVSAEDLLELGRTALHEMEEGMEEEKSE